MRLAAVIGWGLVGGAAVFPALSPAQHSGTSRIEPEIRLSAFYTDNFYYDSDRSLAQSSAGALISPRLGFRSSSGALDLNLQLEGEAGRFDTPGSIDDYEDGAARLDLTLLASRRSAYNLHVGMKRGHDPFGANRTEDAAVRDQELDLWDEATGSATFRFGSPGAILNAQVGVSVLDREYDTNTGATRFLDFTTTAGQYTLFYSLSPKTAMLFDFVRSSVEFDEAFPGGPDPRPGDEFRVRTGARWLAMAKTSGDLRVGYYRRYFDNTSFDDEGFDWQVGMQWAPRARMLLDLSTARTMQASYRDDTSTIVNRSATLSWTQNWTARTSTVLRARTTRSEFLSSASAGSVREDTHYHAGLSLTRALNRYASVLVTVESDTRDTRDSDDRSAEFDRFGAYLGLRLGR